MARIAVVKNEDGLVENVIETWEAPEGYTGVPDPNSEMHIGGTYIDGVFTPKPEDPVPNPVPQTISDRQFFQQLAIMQIITQEEALAAVKTGAIPAALQSIVDTIVDDQTRFNVEMILSGATTFERSHPLTNNIGTAYGMTSEQMDDFFRAAYVLG